MMKIKWWLFIECFLSFFHLFFCGGKQEARVFRLYLKDSFLFLWDGLSVVYSNFSKLLHWIQGQNLICCPTKQNKGKKLINMNCILYSPGYISILLHIILWMNPKISSLCNLRSLKSVLQYRTVFAHLLSVSELIAWASFIF